MTPANDGGPSSHQRSVSAVLLGLVALILTPAALALVALGVFGLATSATPTMRGFNDGATVTLTDSGLSVYARSDADRGTTVCRAVGEETAVLDRPTSQFAVEVTDMDFYEVARGPERLGPGRYTLACEGTDAALYAGPAAPSISASGLVGTAGLLAGATVGIVCILFAALAWMMRARERRGPQRQEPTFSTTPPEHGAGDQVPGGDRYRYRPPPPPA